MSAIIQRKRQRKQEREREREIKRKKERKKEREIMVLTAKPFFFHYQWTFLSILSL